MVAGGVSTYTNDKLRVCARCLTELIRPLVTERQIEAREFYHHRGSARLKRIGGPWNDERSVVGRLGGQAGVSGRRLHSIMSGEVATTSFYLADALLIALDRPDLLYRLRVLVWKNRPNARLVDWERGDHVCDRADLGLIEEEAA